MSTQPVLIAGEWRSSDATSTFRATNPSTQKPLEEEYPVSFWSDLDAALSAAAAAFREIRGLDGGRRADFLEAFADAIDERAQELATIAEQETALPAPTRLRKVEIPRTTGQLRQAAAAARDGSWALATIDTEAGIRSCYGPLGPVGVFGPNNFPFAFNAISGGDFAAAMAAGNPVIAKAHPSHPGTTRRLAEAALEALKSSGLPLSTVQMLYHFEAEDGLRLVADPRIEALAYTGSRASGLRLKNACDAAGKLAYLEMSSINPVVVLPGALRERPEQIVEDFVGSCLLGVGQFCTNPGLVILVRDEATEAFIAAVVEKFRSAPAGTLLNEGVERSMETGVSDLQGKGAEILVGGQPADKSGCSFSNTLLRVSGQDFLERPSDLQREVFGNCSLCVVAEDIDQVTRIIQVLEGNLTGCVYSSTSGGDEELYRMIEPDLRQRVGRLLNDKMPTGVAVSSAMNHGGPYPATGHPGFTAVGFPATVRRFAMLQCYDNVRPERLPPLLADANPTGSTWRWIDGSWSQEDVKAASGA